MLPPPVVRFCPGEKEAAPAFASAGRRRSCRRRAWTARSGGRQDARRGVAAALATGAYGASCYRAPDGEASILREPPLFARLG